MREEACNTKQTSNRLHTKPIFPPSPFPLKPKPKPNKPCFCLFACLLVCMSACSHVCLLLCPFIHQLIRLLSLLVLVAPSKGVKLSLRHVPPGLHRVARASCP